MSSRGPSVCGCFILGRAVLSRFRERAAVWADAHLVPQWRKGWRFLSVQAAALNVAVLTAWASMSDDLKQALPAWLLPVLASGVLFIGAAGAFYNQKKLIQSATDAGADNVRP